MKEIRISIDRGGTFTDVYAHCKAHDPPAIILKLLSVDPANYDDAPTEGIRRVLSHFSGSVILKGTLLDLSNVESIRMGTTVATNALLERKGDRVAFLVTKGFGNILDIGQQARPSIFDLTISKLNTLYDSVFEIDERVTMEEYSEDPDPVQLKAADDTDLVQGTTGETVRILKRIDITQVQAVLNEIKFSGITSLAISFMHSYVFPAHEETVARLARNMGFDVSVSSEIQPAIKLVSRANSATADAYLSPITARYVQNIGKGFKGGLKAVGDRLLFMQSDGGLTSWSKFSGLKAILSGPAGGVVGYSQTSYDHNESNSGKKVPILGFDMGGTSTDVSRYDGMLSHIFETTTAQITIQSPQLDINTVAAGGGSILAWRNGLFVVGPESASAHPGPACYRKGGPLTVTDANLFLGRLLPEEFPCIFGPEENLPLDREVVRTKFEVITAIINADKRAADPKYHIDITPEEVALGFLIVANEAMCRPIRTLTEGKGYIASAHNLASFGGAGGQHACSVAANLGINRVIIHKYSAILSAYGMALADVVHEVQRPESAAFTAKSLVGLRARLEALKQECIYEISQQDFNSAAIEVEMYLNIRYKGTETSLMVGVGPVDTFEAIQTSFEAQHFQQFGFSLERDLLVNDIRCRGVGKSKTSNGKSPYTELATVAKVPLTTREIKRVYFENTGWVDAAVFRIEALTPGAQVTGPAMIIDKTQTIVVTPRSVATALEEHVVIDLNFQSSSSPNEDVSDKIDPIMLSVFGHRFMSIAEQMGQTLQKTSISTNIKERLDFSCALFSPDGGLVANAPHIPVHLGSMSSAVGYQKSYWGKKLYPGDVLMCNHPAYGGSHLPDITIITPVFHPDDSNQIIFWTAARGHHSDIGGITAGSMPPFSKEIWEEGATIEAFKIVKNGVFDETGAVDLLYTQPSKYPGCTGSRSLKDSISDLKAQIAANNKGINLITQVIKDFGLCTVQRYMFAIQENAEQSVRNLLKKFYQKFAGVPLEAQEQIDDGTPINLEITINGETGDAVFDFTGTGPQVYGNLNAPKSITSSAILYVLRSLISVDIPLNQGCLRPITIKIPTGTLLSPSKGAATVGGNVETSQRITDTVLKAFQVMGASQGTCNNLTFGFGGEELPDGSIKPGFGYYETIAGGAGAGDGWDGQSGVQVHMTNTRSTDPEIFEKRYPVILREFSFRKGSGGNGKYNGGDGVIRDIEFRVPVQVSILSERRTTAPYGMGGGQPGAKGRNLWMRKVNTEDEWEVVSIGGKNTCKVSTGDRIIIQTPGGGGFGATGQVAESGLSKRQNNFDSTKFIPRASGSVAERTFLGEGSA
ncbi:hydantoinase B/oxoprolinase [Nadsonia fulvescens var. elongata DSM 6958]|uniref:Hydantoinase B/oxoprolinase n=1 Tax=Nadsonia fulvescens var. elongata DSM 6958 TaxID=857566 RepID=A0A1E3PFM3_9ASCO|nr:hydantoinase B/oxoprolinase [Nadsonia fulvescens var. elongata DSM 6958]